MAENPGGRRLRLDPVRYGTFPQRPDHGARSAAGRRSLPGLGRRPPGRERHRPDQAFPRRRSSDASHPLRAECRTRPAPPVAATRYPPAGPARGSEYGAGQPVRSGRGLCQAGQRGTLPAGSRSRRAKPCTRSRPSRRFEGIDGIFIGPADLAASLGHPGAPGHPDVVAAVEDAIRRVRALRQAGRDLDGRPPFSRRAAWPWARPSRPSAAMLASSHAAPRLCWPSSGPVDRRRDAQRVAEPRPYTSRIGLDDAGPRDASNP